MDTTSALLTTSILGTGLVSGLLYGWSVSVIPGLRRVPDGGYVNTMQHINRAIINPAFVIPYMGVPLLLAAAAITQFWVGDQRRGWLLASAAGTYLLGVLGVTFGGNIPLNDALERFDLAGSDVGAVTERRRSYEAPWVRWHYLRSAASIGAFALASAAAVISAEVD